MGTWWLSTGSTSRYRPRRVLHDARAVDVGQDADAWQTFRDITFPQLRSALVAGALLAFGLSFDEIIVTTFTAGSEQTLPIWIFTNYSRPNQLPIVNVVGLMVIALSIVPVYLANRLSQDPVGAPRGAPAAAGAVPVAGAR
jgi:putative spermidine/putrescine transport system permease protein